MFVTYEDMEDDYVGWVRKLGLFFGMLSSTGGGECCNNCGEVQFPEPVNIGGE